MARWDSTPDICDLIDAVVLGESSDADAASQLVAVEVWCKYLRELLRDTGRYNTRSAIVANQAAELQDGSADGTRGPRRRGRPPPAQGAPAAVRVPPLG